MSTTDPTEEEMVIIEGQKPQVINGDEEDVEVYADQTPDLLDDDDEEE